MTRDLILGTAVHIDHGKTSLVKAHTGEGLDELKATIAGICARVEEKSGKQWFRLAIDRSFIVQGHGTVVTGSATSGSVRIGDELEWQPRGEKVRVRSLQNHDTAV